MFTKSVRVHVKHAIHAVLLKMRRAYFDARAKDYEKLVEFTQNARRGTTVIFSDDLVVMLGFKSKKTIHVLWRYRCEQRVQSRKPMHMTAALINVSV